MRKLAWFAASCSAAVFLAVYVLPEGALVPLGEVCALAALAGLTLRGDRRRRVLLAGFGLAAGLLWTAAYGALFQAPARALAGYEGPVEVTVADWPQATAYGSSVLVRLHPVEGWPVRTLLYLDAPAPDLRPGDGLTVQARLRAADTIAGESTDYYYAKGVRLIAYGEGEGETARPGRPPLWTWPAYVSKALKGAVASAFPKGAAPLVAALLTGDKSGLSDGDYAALRRSGLAHVIAVSGLHVSFLAGLAAALLGGPAAAHRRVHHRPAGLLRGGGGQHPLRPAGGLYAVHASAGAPAGAGGGQAHLSVRRSHAPAAPKSLRRRVGVPPALLCRRGGNLPLFRASHRAVDG